MYSTAATSLMCQRYDNLFRCNNINNISDNYDLVLTFVFNPRDLYYRKYKKIMIIIIIILSLIYVQRCCNVLDVLALR